MMFSGHRLVVWSDVTCVSGWLSDCQFSQWQPLVFAAWCSAERAYATVSLLSVCFPISLSVLTLVYFWFFYENNYTNYVKRHWYASRGSSRNSRWSRAGVDDTRHRLVSSWQHGFLVDIVDRLDYCVCYLCCWSMVIAVPLGQVYRVSSVHRCCVAHAHRELFPIPPATRQIMSRSIRLRLFNTLTPTVAIWVQL